MCVRAPTQAAAGTCVRQADTSWSGAGFFSSMQAATTHCGCTAVSMSAQGTQRGCRAATHREDGLHCGLKAGGRQAAAVDRAGCPGAGKGDTMQELNLQPCRQTQRRHCCAV